MISRRGFFAVLAGVLAAPKALFAKKEVLTVAKINEVAEQAKALKPFRPVFIGAEAGRMAFNLSPEQCAEINRRSAEECRRRGIKMLSL